MSPTFTATMRAATFILALSALLAASSASAQQAALKPVLDKLRQGQPLLVVHRESSVPFSFIDGAGSCSPSRPRARR